MIEDFFEKLFEWMKRRNYQQWQDAHVATKRKERRDQERLRRVQQAQACAIAAEFDYSRVRQDVVRPDIFGDPWSDGLGGSVFFLVHRMTMTAKVTQAAVVAVNDKVG